MTRKPGPPDPTGLPAVSGTPAHVANVAAGDELFQAELEGLVRALGRASKRIARRIAAIDKDLARVEEANALSERAQWLVAEAARAPRGARSLAVTDWSTGEPKVIELPLDPAKSAREQVEAIFKQARRIKRGAVIAEGRRKEAEARGEHLQGLVEQARIATNRGELEAIAKRARTLAPGDFAFDADAETGPRAPRVVQPRRAAYRTFLATSGLRIFVGRGGAENDLLTLHVARPHDLWLHVRGRPGAHVVVPLHKGHSCPPEVLVDAAHLAAHFSDARGETIVEVEYTPKRFLRKPRGSPPGLVVVSREKVLSLRVDGERVSRLVAREETGGASA
jgi:predicted ribosome quality control (RQC) complex YloA/Tae2 family protein